MHAFRFPCARRPIRSRLVSAHFWVTLAALVAAVPSAQAAWDETVVVNARVFNGYTRTKLPDGTFKPEHFAVGQGGQWKATMVDKSIDRLPFKTIVQTIAPPLVAQGYLPSADPEQIDLLILIFWGTTEGAHDGQYDHGQDAVFRAINNTKMEIDKAAPSGLRGRQIDDDNALNAAVTGWRHGDEGVGGEENAHRLQVIRRARSANSA